MSHDNMQMQRWELKYVIPEAVALALREFVSSYLEIDEYGAGRPNLSYSIHNLYLDSEDLQIYWGTINGNKNRFKLRLRFYADNSNPEAPVFFEIKRRMNDAILKQRCGVRRPAVEAVLAGRLPEASELVSQDARQLAAVQRFVELSSDVRACPVAHVSYDREAWISPHDNSVRVTFDRNVLISPEFTARFTSQMDDPTPVFGPLVILELKFTGRFPDWFADMVRVFGLRQGSASKYADGIAVKGEHRFLRDPSIGLKNSQLGLAAERREARVSRLAKWLGQPGLEMA
ncbi:MAG: VTC domain-containing protein [Verrucomicrobiota bacterium]